MNTRSPHTTAVELQRSGKGVRQRTFSFVLQRRGRSFSLEIPFPSGPRQPGQGLAKAVPVKTSRATTDGRMTNVE
jgi:hypothetical protein